MAGSRINIECKRFGCVKNLLACYANCRYNTRCDDLRNEIGDRLEAATSDINAYLTERGRPPVLIQLAKRGVRFNAVAARPAPKAKATVQTLAAPSPRRIASRRASAPSQAPKPDLQSPPATRPAKKRRRRARRPAAAISREVKTNKSIGGTMPADHEKQSAAPQSQEKAARKSSGRAAKKERASKKRYIILNGKTATLVDEKGLLAHLLSGQAQDTRIFEAIEVEARLQIAPIR